MNYQLIELLQQVIDELSEEDILTTDYDDIPDVVEEITDFLNK